MADQEATRTRLIQDLANQDRRMQEELLRITNLQSRRDEVRRAVAQVEIENRALLERGRQQRVTFNNLQQEHGNTSDFQQLTHQNTPVNPLDRSVNIDTSQNRMFYQNNGHQGNNRYVNNHLLTINDQHQKKVIDTKTLQFFSGKKTITSTNGNLNLRDSSIKPTPNQETK